MNRFDLTHAPLALYHFDRDLADASGNGLDLTGTASYHDIAPGVVGLAPGSDVRRPGYDAELALTGDVTVQVIGRMYSTPSAGLFASFTASGETLATNTLWQFGPETAHTFRCLSESGAGVDATHIADSVESLPPAHTLFHAAAVRSGGVWRVYLNGRQFGPPSAAMATPTGGTAAFLRVMFGGTAFGLAGLKIVGAALTAAQVRAECARTLGVQATIYATAWVGATTDTSATVVVRTAEATPLCLDVNGTLTAPQTPDSDGVARFDLTGLAADTLYTCAVVADDAVCATVARFRTHPAAAGTPAHFMVAFGGDARVGSVHPVFDTILRADPLMFLHLGDMHYGNIATNTPAAFQAAFDTVQACPPQGRLLASVATAYVWDDHDFGGNNCDGSSASKPAAAGAYRSRVPHYALPHATAIYQTWDIGRVRFVVTDQRSEASPSAMADGPTKSVLGSTQKSWFKALIASSPGMLIVWICPRWFANANHADSWNNFAVERAELVDHIKANAHGRVVVLEADQHTLAIDDGSNVDHATGGGEPLRCFRAAPLDQTPSAPAATYSHGEWDALGQFGTMSVADAGESSIGVTWRGFNAAGTELVEYAFSVAV